MKNRLSTTIRNKIPIKTTEGIPSKLIELVRLRVAQIHQCPDSIAEHRERLKGFGETEGRLHELETWGPSILFDGQERAALALCETITRNPEQPLPDRLIQEMRRYFTKSAIVSLTLAILAVNDWSFRDNSHGILSNQIPASS